MAVIWRQQRNDVAYEVRRHGRTVRLYANGIQHSEFHPDRLVTGSVWDLLWLPVLFHPPQQIKRILVLGLGGGSLIPPLVNLCQPDVIEAVDLDPIHLSVAEQFFQVGQAGVTCHCADAVDFVRDYKGEPFDLVIEDLFPPSDTTVSRAIPATGAWLGKLAKLVKPDGMLVMNFGDWSEYRGSWASGDKAMRGWQRRFRFATPDCHNAVIAFLREPSTSKALRERLRQHRQLASELAFGRLDYSVRDVAKLGMLQD